MRPAIWACATSAFSATASRSCRRSRRFWSHRTCGCPASSAPGTCPPWWAYRPYRFVTEVYRKPLVVAGFRAAGHSGGGHDVAAPDPRRPLRRCENQFKRVVPEDGNPAALALMGKVFALRPHFEWRLVWVTRRVRCGCTGRLRGVRRRSCDTRCPACSRRARRPAQCAARCSRASQALGMQGFGTACYPETPIGTCMVSPEGACCGLLQLRPHAPRRREAGGQSGQA